MCPYLLLHWVLTSTRVFLSGCLLRVCGENNWGNDKCSNPRQKTTTVVVQVMLQPSELTFGQNGAERLRVSKVSRVSSADNHGPRSVSHTFAGRSSGSPYLEDQRLLQVVGNTHQHIAHHQSPRQHSAHQNSAHHPGHYQHSTQQQSPRQNSTDHQSSRQHSAQKNSAHYHQNPRQNSAHQNSTHQDSAHQQSPRQHSAHQNIAHQHSTYQQNPHQNSTHQQSPRQHSTRQNITHQQSPRRNSAHQNSTHQQSPRWNSAHQNSTHQQSPRRNSAHQNSTHQQSPRQHSSAHHPLPHPATQHTHHQGLEQPHQLWHELRPHLQQSGQQQLHPHQQHRSRQRQEAWSKVTMGDDHYGDSHGTPRRPRRSHSCDGNIHLQRNPDERIGRCDPGAQTPFYKAALALMQAQRQRGPVVQISPNPSPRDSTHRPSQDHHRQQHQRDHLHHHRHCSQQQQQHGQPKSILRQAPLFVHKRYDLLPGVAHSLRVTPRKKVTFGDDVILPLQSDVDLTGRVLSHMV